MEKRLSEVTMAVAVPSREEGVAVPSPATAAEGAVLPAGDVLARLASGTPGLPGDEAARRLQVGPNTVRSHRAHALSVLASQLRSPLLMLLAVTVMAVADQIEITG
jgi:DNA-binding CsgD family transcriptional regulator